MKGFGLALRGSIDGGAEPIGRLNPRLRSPAREVTPTMCDSDSSKKGRDGRVAARVGNGHEIR